MIKITPLQNHIALMIQCTINTYHKIFLIVGFIFVAFFFYFVNFAFVLAFVFHVVIDKSVNLTVKNEDPCIISLYAHFPIFCRNFKTDFRFVLNFKGLVTVTASLLLLWNNWGVWNWFKFLSLVIRLNWCSMHYAYLPCEKNGLWIFRIRLNWNDKLVKAV